MIINDREFKQFRDTVYHVDMDGNIFSQHTQSFITPRISKSKRSNTSYYKIAIYHNKQRYDVGLHVIVAECWIPNPDNKPTVNHKDGDGLNCKSYNLEWATRSEQALHTFDTGLNIRRYGVIQYTMDNIEVQRYTSALDAHRITGISNASINHVCNGNRISAGGYKWRFIDNRMAEV